VVTRTDPIDVAFTVPQGQLNAIQQQAAGGLPVTALDQDGKANWPRAPFPPSTTRSTPPPARSRPRRALPIRWGAGPVLFPNQFVNVKMLVQTLHQVPVVPVSALRHGAPGDFVFVVQPDKTVKMVVVKIGPSDGVNTAVLGPGQGADRGVRRR
jgi:multidrug efflux system membrane fusion protein